jgi:hypothetical protein
VLVIALTFETLFSSGILADPFIPCDQAQECLDMGPDYSCHMIDGAYLIGNGDGKNNFSIYTVGFRRVRFGNLI